MLTMSWQCHLSWKWWQYNCYIEKYLNQKKLASRIWAIFLVYRLRDPRMVFYSAKENIRRKWSTRRPPNQNLKLTNDDGSPLVDVLRYRRLIERLLYLTLTRPYIQFAVHFLSQFISTPRQTHMEAAVRIIRTSSPQLVKDFSFLQIMIFNPGFHERTKHVEMNCYFDWERTEFKDIFDAKFQ